MEGESPHCTDLLEECDISDKHDEIKANSSQRQHQSSSKDCLISSSRTANCVHNSENSSQNELFVEKPMCLLPHVNCPEKIVSNDENYNTVRS